MSRKQERQINKVEDEVVRSCQREAFMNDYKALVSGKPLWPNSPLFKLNPVLDEDGGIRSNERLQFAEITCHMVYDFLSYCCEDTGLQSSLLSVTMNGPTIQQVLIFCCPK